MDRIELLADEIMAAYQAGRVRLWLANFADLTEDFDQWAGLIRISAEHHVRNWKPDRSALLDRLRRREAVGGPDLNLKAGSEELLPLAREGLARELASRQVPSRIADRAKTVVLAQPPLQQWRMTPIG